MPRPRLLTPEERRSRKNARAKVYRSENLDKTREATKRARAKRLVLPEAREAFNKKQRQYKLANADKRNAEVRERKLSNRPAHMVQRAKLRAKNLGLSFDLVAADIEPLPSHCPVLGIEIDYDLTRPRFNSPTLDRVDNNKGYVSGNVIVVSRRANVMKSDGTVEDMRRVYEFYRNWTPLK
jgi:hypothetical protein